MNTFTRFLPTLLCLGLSPAFADYQEGGDGNVTFEAEAYHAITVSDVLSGGAITHDWVGQCPPKGGGNFNIGNYRGDALMFASPEDNVTYQSGFIIPGSPPLDTVAPRMDYRVDFTTTGTYYIWVRMWALSGESNSVHMGVDGIELASAARIVAQSNNRYIWVGERVTVDDQFVTATLDIASAGVHTINVWLRESGVYVDAIHLTTNAGFDPNVDPDPTADANFGTPLLKTLNAVFDPDGGPVPAADTVALSSCTPGSMLYYTTDGSDPTPDLSNPNTIDYSVSGPFSVAPDDRVTVKAIASTPPGVTYSDSEISARIFDTDELPTFTSTAVTAATPDVAYAYDITSTDADGDSLVVSATTLPAWLTLADGGTGDGSATLTGTPTNAELGDHPVVLVVTDPEDGTGTQSFTITVAVNNAPTISGTPATSVAKNVPYSFTATAADIDGDTLLFTVANEPAWLTLTDNGDGTATLSGTPGDGDVGITTGIVITVDDQRGAPNSTASLPAFDLTVTNQAPTFTSTAVISVQEGSLYSYSITTSDADVGETLAITAPTKPAWLTLTDNGDGTATLSGTPGPGDVGDHTVELVVTDASNAPATQSFTITVANVNDAPTFTSTPVTTATQDVAYSYPITSSDVDAGDSLVVSATTLPSWLTLTDSGTGSGSATLSGTPGAGDVGDHPVVLEVSDGNGGTDTQSFTVTVAAAGGNNPPTFASTPVTSVQEGSPYSYSITSSDVDAGDSLVVSATTLPSWLTLTDSGTGSGSATLSGTPTAAEVGDHPVVLEVSDGNGGTDTQSFTITVANVNDAPTFTSTPVTTATQDVAYSYPITSSDVDAGDSLVVTATTLPTWLTLTDGGTGDGSATLTGTPTAAEVGDHAVVLEVSDGNGGTDTQSYTVTVAAADSSSDSGGGGGCTLNPEAKQDPVLPLLALASLGYLLRRRRTDANK